MKLSATQFHIQCYYAHIMYKRDVCTMKTFIDHLYNIFLKAYHDSFAIFAMFSYCYPDSQGMITHTN